MDYLPDTNISLRERVVTDPLNPQVTSALQTLKRRGDRLFIVPQNLYEAWNVFTHPIANNGFGLTPQEAREMTNDLLTEFVLLPDPLSLAFAWLDLVTQYAVSGVKVHDDLLEW